MSVARILVVEDDPRITSFLESGLQAESYHVEVARDGPHGLDLALRGEFQLIILDYMLPGLDGLEVCARLRAEGCRSLILMLTARDTLKDKIAGLKGGADDYLTKPFVFGELLARVEALLRRSDPRADAVSVLQVGDLQMDLTTKSVRRAGRQIDLTPREFALLAYLMTHAGAVVSRARVLSDVWGTNFDPGTKVVDVYIRYLRAKVDLPDAHPLIRTVRGFGYTISAAMEDGSGDSNGGDGGRQL